MEGVTLPESVVEKLRKLKEVRDDQDVVSKKINKFHSRLSETTWEKAEKYSDKLWQKLEEYYVNAKRLAELEEKLCAQCIAELNALSQTPMGATQPNIKKRAQGPGDNRKAKAKHHWGATAPGGNASNAFGGNSANTGGHAVPALVSRPAHRKPADGRTLPSVGEMVAARVSPSEAEKDDWIVVKVIAYDPETSMYEVLDEEPGDEEEAGPRKYKLEASCIIPFPKVTDSAAPEFPPGCHVLAVYPGTTSLYRATVALRDPPRKNKEDEYFLEFDDDEEEGFEGLPQRRVSFHHVVPLPAGHRQ